MKKAKARFFAFILYPESMPEDWLQRLRTLDIAMEVSPLHDQDQNADGTFKKAHYHVLYVAKNPVTTDSVRLKIKRTLGNDVISYVEIVDGIKNYHEYLTHESEDAKAKHKHVYDKADLIQINGFDIDRYVTLDEGEKQELRDLLIEFIYRYEISNAFDLMDFCYENRDIYALPSDNAINEVIRANTGLFRLWFDGAYQRRAGRKQEEKAQETELIKQELMEIKTKLNVKD